MAPPKNNQPTTRQKVNKSKTSLEIQCKSCDNGFEISTVGIPEDFFTYVNEKKVPGYVWLCESCREEKEQFSNMYTNFNKKLENIEKQISLNSNSDLNDKVTKLENSIDLKLKSLENKFLTKVDDQKKDINNNIKLYNETNVKKFSEAVKQNINSNSDNNIAISSINKNYEAISSINKNFESLKTKINQEQENKARMARENNICIFNVPESTDADQGKAKREDVRKLHTILDDKIKLIKDDIKQVYRKNIRDKNKPRPIIITLTSKEKRTELLKLRNLKYEEVVESDEEVGETNDDADKAQDLIKTTMIFISKDRTQLQQEQHRKLVEELKERRGKGEDVTIRNDKIIKNQSFRGVSQLNWE